MNFKNETISDLVGKTFKSVAAYVGGEGMRFISDDGTGFLFHHQQDCCEHVSIEDVVGDLSDLEGTPILSATANSKHGEDSEEGSETWTFYDFRTNKGTVSVRWYGSSNGYYSESVQLSSF